MGRQPAIAKTYLHAKDPYHAKYQLLINKCKMCNGSKHCNHSNVFIEYSIDMDNIDENTDEKNPSKNANY